VPNLPAGAANLPAGAANPPAGATDVPRSGRRSWLVLAAVFALLLLGAFAVTRWLFVRRRRRDGAKTDGAALAPKPTGRSARHWLLAWLLPGFFLGVLLLMQVMAPAEPVREEVAEFYHDFRRQQLPPELTLVHAEEGQTVHFEPEGLRIKIAKPWIHPRGGVGVKTTFPVRGDFEVTATVEVLHLEAPPSGAGSQVGITVDTPSQGAYIQRFVGLKGNPAVMWGRRLQVPGKKNPQWRQSGIFCDEALLRLRLRRQGTTLHYLWAPGAAGDNFQEFQQFDDFVGDDIDSVRLSAGTGQTACNLEVRLIDLRIRQGQLRVETPREAPPEFYHDFRGRPLPDELKLYHAEEGPSLRFEPEGLRITIPNTWTPPFEGVGVVTAFGLRGDFEVTATVEMLEFKKPPQATGAGVGIYVGTATSGAHARRIIGQNGLHSVTGNHHFRVPEKKNPVWQGDTKPCSDSLLRLRLKRTGTMLYHSWAPGAGAEPFVEMFRCEFGNDDIEQIRLTTGSRNSEPDWDIDARLIDLRIRRGADPATPAPRRRSTLALALGGVMVLLLGVFAASLWRARPSRSPEARG
jgi:hypothetical protein